MRQAFGDAGGKLPWGYCAGRKRDPNVSNGCGQASKVLTSECLTVSSGIRKVVRDLIRAFEVAVELVIRMPWQSWWARRLCRWKSVFRKLKLS